MEEKKQKRVLSIELDENVKKVSITGLGDDETVVMKQELDEEELDQATGGGSTSPYKCSNHGACLYQCSVAACDRVDYNYGYCQRICQGNCAPDL